MAAKTYCQCVNRKAQSIGRAKLRDDITGVAGAALTVRRAPSCAFAIDVAFACAALPTLPSTHARLLIR